MPKLTAQIEPRSVSIQRSASFGKRNSEEPMIGWDSGEVSMAASLVKELYNAPNGDRWTLCRDAAGKLVVFHQPNEASGGQASETDVNLFLAVGGRGPEYQALTKALADVDQGTQVHERKEQIPAEAMDRLSRALGQAVAQSWSTLPQEIQQRLFEAAVRSQGETIRQELAVYLHGKHDRTSDVGQSRAVPEPDSLGG
jgi:phage terminase Nu1 subunit (DNA packaging protein)